MSRYQRHVFVCTNKRPAGHAKGSCSDKGSVEIRDLFKTELARRNLREAVRANNCGCLDLCERGPSVVIYPEGIWYVGVRKEDVVEIIERTILRGEIIERLLVNDARYKPASLNFGPLPSTPQEKQ